MIIIKKRTFIFTILLILLPNVFFAQPIKNIDVIYNLVEDNVNKLLIELPHEIDQFKFEYLSLPEYNGLKNRFIYHLDKRNYLSETFDSTLILKYSLDRLGVVYSEPFRGGLLSDYKVERKVILSGTFAFGSANRVIRSNIVESTYKDTIFYSEINDVESANLSVTQGTKPPEPLFESLLEPVIAVGAVIITVILLFTVRSK